MYDAAAGNILTLGGSTSYTNLMGEPALERYRLCFGVSYWGVWQVVQVAAEQCTDTKTCHYLDQVCSHARQPCFAGEVPAAATGKQLHELMPQAPWTM